MPSIKLPDGSVRAVPEGSTVLQVAESIGKRLAQAAVVGKVDGKLVDVSARIPERFSQWGFLRPPCVCPRRFRPMSCRVQVVHPLGDFDYAG